MVAERQLRVTATVDPRCLLLGSRRAVKSCTTATSRDETAHQQPPDALLAPKPCPRSAAKLQRYAALHKALWAEHRDPPLPSFESGWLTLLASHGMHILLVRWLFGSPRIFCHAPLFLDRRSS